MRVLQLIDTLRPGGAERVALNYANALPPYVEKSYLCCTRGEGALKSQLNREVGYIFLDKRNTVDLKAIRRLNLYVRENKITIIHAHATSYFMGWVIKIFNPEIKFIWHLHHGAYSESFSRRLSIYRLISRYCSAIITVNESLEKWAKKKLKSKQVEYIKNFTAHFPNENSQGMKDFPGSAGKRIVCVANLRPEKNHGLLLDAFSQLIKEEPNATLHLFGMAYEDLYSKSIEAIANDLDGVYYHGLHSSINDILGSFDIGVLSSDSEGLPLALLEYAIAGLPVVVTHVGQCSQIVKENGRCVPPGNRNALAEALLFYLKSKPARETDGLALKKDVEKEYGVQKIVPQVIKIYETSR